MKSILHVSAVVLFGILFIAVTISQPVPEDRFSIWWFTLWSIGAIIGGIFSAVRIDSMMEWNRKYFTKLNERGGIFLIYKNAPQMYAEPYMKHFGLAISLLFVTIGVVILLKYHTGIFG